MPTQNEIRVVGQYFAGLYDIQQYPMVPEWMNLASMISGQRNPNGEFVNERKFIAGDNDEFTATSSLKWINHGDQLSTEFPSAYKLEKVSSIYGNAFQFYGTSGIFSGYSPNTGGYIECIKNE